MTSKTLPRVRVTGRTARRIDPGDIKAALGAEIIKPKSQGAYKIKTLQNGTLVRIKESYLRGYFLKGYKQFINKIGIIVGTYDYPALEYGYVIYVNGKTSEFLENEFEVLK